MPQMPDWWLTSSGIFFILGAVAMGLLSVVAVALVFILLELRKAILALNVKVQNLTEKVDSIATNVQDVTTEVGTRTKGIVRVVDQHAGAAFELIEKFAPALIGLTLVARVLKLVRSR